MKKMRHLSLIIGMAAQTLAVHMPLSFDSAGLEYLPEGAGNFDTAMFSVISSEYTGLATTLATQLDNKHYFASIDLT